MHIKNNIFQGLTEELNTDTDSIAALRAELVRMEAEVKRAKFRFNRTMKDKTIMVNLLNKTIGDLQENQEQLEALNMRLFDKNKEIALKNLQLTKQKKVQEQQSQKLENNLRKLEMSYRELEQFSYIASHDLKSPLRAISSYAQLLRRRYMGQIDAEADSFIDFIVQGVYTMDNILSDLLEYSRTGKEVEYKTTDLADLFSKAKANIQFEIIESKAKIECAPLPQIAVSETGIIQLFQNLLANSIKFCKQKTPYIIVQANQEHKDFWHVSVEDNGIGLDPSYADKVFQPFQRISPQEFDGTGMGLAICHKIVQIHHGEIWYESSKILGGTAFHFTLSTRL